MGLLPVYERPPRSGSPPPAHNMPSGHPRTLESSPDSPVSDVSLNRRRAQVGHGRDNHAGHLLEFITSCAFLVPIPLETRVLVFDLCVVGNAKESSTNEETERD